MTKTTGMMAGLLGLALGTSGCLHYSFEQRPRANAVAERQQNYQQPRTTQFKERHGTYLGGFVGTGRIDTTRYCENPVRTETKVTPGDAAIALFTGFIYTPHTLIVTCPLDDEGGRNHRASRW